MFIDTHSHLFFPNFNDDIDEVIERAKENGVDYIIVPATDIKTANEVISLLKNMKKFTVQLAFIRTIQKIGMIL